jgi:hypothetical protein
MNEKNLPVLATTHEPADPYAPDPMDPRMMYCGTSKPAPRSDFDTVADPYALTATATPTPTDEWGLHYAVPGAEGLVCMSDHQAWPCSSIQTYSAGVTIGTLDERDRNYYLLRARFDALPLTNTEGRDALYEAAEHINAGGPA